MEVVCELTSRDEKPVPQVLSTEANAADRTRKTEAQRLCNSAKGTVEARRLPARPPGLAVVVARGNA